MQLDDHPKIKRLVNWFFYLDIWNLLKKISLYRYVLYGKKDRLFISNSASVQNAILNVISGSITIEDNVFFGHNVSVLTGTHDYTRFGLERITTVPSTGRDIIIKKGTWVCTNSVILGPCIIGENSVIASGSVVLNDVPPYSLVGGIPAKVIKTIEKK